MELFLPNPKLQPIRLGTKIDFISPITLQLFISSFLSSYINFEKIAEENLLRLKEKNPNINLYWCKEFGSMKHENDAWKIEFTKKIHLDWYMIKIRTKDNRIFINYRYLDKRSGILFESHFCLQNGILVAKKCITPHPDCLYTFEHINNSIEEYIKIFIEMIK